MKYCYAFPIIMIKILKNRLFYSIQSAVHPYLMEGLKKNGLFPLRPCQEKAFRLFYEGKNVLINEMDGSGKTLAYVLPVLNRILYTKKQSPPKSGAVIITLNKELALSIYRLIRTIDFDNLFNVNRSGSITHYSPVVDEMCKRKEEQDEDLIMDLMYKNVANSVDWPHTDILISTPPILYRILSEKASNSQKFSPEMIVVDEADLTLSKEDLLNYFKKNYAYINKLSAKEGTHRYFLASPYDVVLSDSKSSPFGGKQFEPTDYECENLILNSLKCSAVRIQPFLIGEEILNEKLSILAKLVRNRLGRRIIIYCSSKIIDKVTSALKSKLDINCLEYYAKMSSEKRMAAIYDFNNQISNVLVTTELANRGFSYPPIDAIISFDPCEVFEEELLRMSRSNKAGAQYILIEDEKQAKMRSPNLLMLKENFKFGMQLQNVKFRKLELRGQEEVLTD